MRKKTLVTTLIIVGVLISYVHQMAPSPFLIVLRDYFGLMDRDALLNLSVSIIYPALIVASLLGGYVEHKLGLRRMFILVLAFLAVGVLLNFTAGSYGLFLLARVLFGIGFGLGIPFIGSAIMNFYQGSARETMNTLNGLFPFLGTFISFFFMVPLSTAFNGSWKAALGVWGLPIVIVLLVWIVGVRQTDLNAIRVVAPSADQSKPVKGIYRDLLSRKEIMLLTIIFMCDFFVYSYITVILPTFLYESSSMTETAASLWAAVAFPGIGLVGCVFGGWLAARYGRRKVVLLLGVGLELAGVLAVGFLAPVSVVYSIIGFALFGFGNGVWLPAMYNIPMELPKMTPSLAGAAFALMSACGFVCGFISPALGGWISTALMGSCGIAGSIAAHAYALRMSLFLFGFVNLLGLVCAIIIRETGPGRKPKQAALL